MAQNKPSKPSVTLPNNFGGVKSKFSESKISNGYEASTPEIVEGGNLNYMLDGLFRNTKYMRTVLDFVRDTPAGKTFWTNANGQMDYQIPAIIATNTEFNTGTATDRVPNVKQVVDKIATKSNNGDVVHKTGDETISGTKIITNDVRFQKGSNTEYASSIYRQGSDNGFVIVMDVQDNSAWMSYLKFFTNGDVVLNAKTYLSLQGTVAAPTPSTSDNSTKVATTAFVKNNLAGGVSTIATSNLTASRALISNSSGKVAVSEVTSTELGYLDGVTSNVQTQLNAKQATVTGAASTITGSNLTASRALISNSNGKVAVSEVTSTELGYLDGVTSNVQTQLNAKAADSAVVKLTGNQSIAGNKTFTSSIITEGDVISKNTSMTKGTAPSGGDQSRGFYVTDKDGKTMARFRQRYTPAKANNVDIVVHKANSADDTEVAVLGVAYPASGNPWASAPASDANGSIVTTVSKSKAQNGYFKLGNGLIIQWGRYDNGSNSAGFKATITLPTPFTNTNYSFSLVGTRQNDDDITAAVNAEGRAKATTYINFQCSRLSGTSAGIRYIDWLAIGY